MTLAVSYDEYDPTNSQQGVAYAEVSVAVLYEVNVPLLSPSNHQATHRRLEASYPSLGMLAPSAVTPFFRL
jgi:hypothetical protein